MSRAGQAARTWTREKIMAQGVRMTGLLACQIVYGYGPTKAYEALAAGDVDFRVLRRGKAYIVPTSEVLRVLGLADDPPAAT